MCHYQVIFDVVDYTLESQLSLTKLRAIRILSDFPIIYSAVLKLMKLVVILPVTIASNKRFFWALGRGKYYLRSTMGNGKLSNLIIMAVEKGEIMDLNRLVNNLSEH